MIEPEDRWEPGGSVQLVNSGGPDRIYDDSPTTDLPKPVGFTARPDHVWRRSEDNENEPLLWEGDNA